MQGHARDILWAYTASLSRVLSWVLIYGLLYRKEGPEAAAQLALVRWTLGLLNYASAGLSPAIIHHAAKAQTHAGAELDLHQQIERRPGSPSAPSSILHPPSSLRSIYKAGITLSWLAATAGLIPLLLWTQLPNRSPATATLVALFGVGMLIDIAADAWGAILQSQNQIKTDYQCQTTLEFLWATTASIATLYRHQLNLSWPQTVAGAYLLCAITTATLRAILAKNALRDLPSNSAYRLPPTAYYRPLLKFGALVMLAQIADFLYAPTDYLLIQWLIDLKTVAIYANAVQFDAGILLLAGGLASALLPISANAFAKGDHLSLRRFYLQGTLLNFLLLSLLSFLAWLAAPAIYKLWLGNKMPQSRAILPIVLIPTIIGGTASIGRSILLAIGKVKPFTLAVLLTGLANVLLSYTFVAHLNLGLTGIILGTIVAVTARCAFWMPWYTLKSLKNLNTK